MSETSDMLMALVDRVVASEKMLADTNQALQNAVLAAQDGVDDHEVEVHNLRGQMQQMQADLDHAENVAAESNKRAYDLQSVARGSTPQTAFAGFDPKFEGLTPEEMKTSIKAVVMLGGSILNKIALIKAIRAGARLGLKDAKDLMDAALEEKLPRPDSNYRIAILGVGAAAGDPVAECASHGCIDCKDTLGEKKKEKTFQEMYDESVRQAGIYSRHYGSAIACNHANENPSVCSCSTDCYCRAPGHTCEGRS